MLEDDRGLWLLIVPGGGKYWRLRYWVEGKEKKVSLGTYPSITLREARERRDALHKSRAEDVDPAEGGVRRALLNPPSSIWRGSGWINSLAGCAVHGTVRRCPAGWNDTSSPCLAIKISARSWLRRFWGLCASLRTSGLAGVRHRYSYLASAPLLSPCRKLVKKQWRKVNAKQKVFMISASMYEKRAISKLT